MSVALSLLGMGGVALWLGEPADLLGLLRMDRRALALALGLLLFSYACGGARIALLAGMAGTRMSFAHGARAHLLGMFAAAVTPSGGGNQLAIALALRREGMSHARTWAVTVYTSILDLLFFAWAVPASLAGLALGPGGLGRAWAWAALPAAALFAGLWFVLAFRIGWLAPLVLRLFSLAPVRRWRRRALRFVRQLERSTRLVTGGGYLAHGVLQLLTAGMHLAGHAIFFVYATVGLGAPLELLPTLMALLLVSLLAYLVPTPGASGYMEIATSLMFTRQVDASWVTPAVLAWRVTNHYLAMLVGPVVAGPMLARSLTQRMEEPSGDGRAPDDGVR